MRKYLVLQQGIFVSTADGLLQLRCFINLSPSINFTGICMWKMIVTNAMIPVVSIIVSLLEIARLNGERVLPLPFRLWIIEYGRFVVIAQLAVMIISFIIWQNRRYRFLAIGVFILWIFIQFLISRIPGLYG